MSYAHQLVERCRRPVEQDAQYRAVSHVIDWMACAAIGSSTEGAEALWQGTGLPVSRVVPVAVMAADEQPLDPWRELLYEASLGNILEMDDVHRTSLVHPGSVVVPAALFMGRHLRASGSEVLNAVVRGYEATIRFGRAVGPAHYMLWHNTATCGVLGAAAAVCSLLGLRAQAWTDAFGLAVTQAAGLWQVRLEPCMAKQWHLARSVQTGIQAALYAQAGVPGPQQIFEGEKGYFKAKCPDGDLTLITAHPDHPWCVFETSFKPWPACRHAHPAIDAALALREQLPWPDGQAQADAAWLDQNVQDVYVHVYRDALAFCDNPDPDTPATARFSLQHAVAVSLLGGPPQLSDFESASLVDARVRSIRNKVRVVESAALTQRYPRHFSASMQLVLKTGAQLVTNVDDAWGDPERPMSVSQVQDKARLLCEAAGWTPDALEAELQACSMLFDRPKQAVSLSPIRLNAIR